MDDQSPRKEKIGKPRGGTLGSNNKQNKQVDDALREHGLGGRKDIREQLHRKDLDGEHLGWSN